VIAIQTILIELAKSGWRPNNKHFLAKSDDSVPNNI